MKNYNDIIKGAGEGFMKALMSAAKTRVSRKDQYGDAYKQDELMFLYYQIRNKLRRFRSQFIVNEDEEQIKDINVLIDSLKDLICYAAFAIENAQALANEEAVDSFFIGLLR